MGSECAAVDFATLMTGSDFVGQEESSGPDGSDKSGFPSVSAPQHRRPYINNVLAFGERRLGRQAALYEIGGDSDAESVGENVVKITSDVIAVAQLIG